MKSLVFLVFVVFFVACSSGSDAPYTVQDCQTDFSCFLTAASSCEPAHVLFTDVMPGAKYHQKTVHYYELKSDAENCFVYMQILSMEKVYSDKAIALLVENGFTEDMIAEAQVKANKALDQYEGKDGVCTFNSSDATLTFLTKLEQGTLEGNVFCEHKPVGTIVSCRGVEDWKDADCRGLIFPAVTGDLGTYLGSKGY